MCAFHSTACSILCQVLLDVGPDQVVSILGHHEHLFLSVFPNEHIHVLRILYNLRESLRGSEGVVQNTLVVGDSISLLLPESYLVCHRLGDVRGVDLHRRVDVSPQVLNDLKGATYQTCFLPMDLTCSAVIPDINAA